MNATEQNAARLAKARLEQLALEFREIAARCAITASTTTHTDDSHALWLRSLERAASDAREHLPSLKKAHDRLVAADAKESA